ncbi:MAG: 3-hydroxybutyryl-CoA dehydrogenase [Actinomycetota bacterium]
MGMDKIGVCGAGIMGSGLVQLAVVNGYEAVLRSRTAESASAARAQLETSLDKLVAKERMTSDERDAALTRALFTADVSDLSDCDLVIECVVEDIDVKRELFRELDQVCKPHTLLATNTSTLPVVELAVATQRPDQVCGVHFFNPVHAMELVEIVPPLTASRETVDAVADFATSCGKRAIEVKDEAGFVVNALLFPYLNAAISMLERGTASMEDIDAAMKSGANYAMGPFALLDLVGLDTSLSILDALHAEFGRPGDVAAPTLRRLVTAGHLGRKTGRGFYTY